MIKQKLKIKRFCNGTAPGPTNLDAQDNDPIRYPCVPSDDTRAVTKCSDPYGNLCTAGTPGCTQGLVVALSEADPNTSDVTVSLSRRVKNDSASVAFAGRQAVKQPQSPTNGVNINTISYAPQNIRLDQYMFSRRLYLMKTDRDQWRRDHCRCQRRKHPRDLHQYLASRQVEPQCGTEKMAGQGLPAVLAGS
jgi:hypothetical protein